MDLSKVRPADHLALARMSFVADPNDDDVTSKVDEVPVMNADVVESIVVSELLPDVLIIFHVP